MEYAAQPAEVAVARPDSGFLPRVFGWMFLGLCITGGIAGLIGSNDALLTDITESPGIVLGVIIGQLVLVIALVAAINRIPVGLATLLFLVYSATVGITFAFIFELYTTQSILYWVTTYAGVLIFAALTAYDMQKLTQISRQSLEGEAEGRAAIMGALALYLDFINLFLFLLRIFGRAR